MIADISLCDLDWDKERFCEVGLGSKEEEVNLVQIMLEVKSLVSYQLTIDEFRFYWQGMISETLNAFSQLAIVFRSIKAIFYSQLYMKSNHTNVFLFYVFIWFQAPWNLNKLGKAEIRDCAITIVTLIKREFSNGILEHFKDIPIGS